MDPKPPPEETAADDGEGTMRPELQELADPSRASLAPLSLSGRETLGDAAERTLTAPETAGLPENAPAPELSDGQLTLLEEIGQGGMGTIYRARQTSLEREVAVKIPRKAERQRAQFMSEALATGFLEHPNIVPVHELGVTPKGEVLLSMKLVKGVSWKQLLHAPPATGKDPKKPPEELGLQKHLSFLIQVCHALSFAHDNKVLHLDLKPENVMIGDYGEVLVMDWGLALDIRSDEEREGAPRGFLRRQLTAGRPFGTPAYFAPELADGRVEDLGPRTDVYLLGAILYEILERRPPHPSDSLTRAMLSASEGAPPSFGEQAPRELQSICVKALAKDPADRYGSVKELREALEDFQRHRESMLISDRSRSLLDQCQRSVASLSSAGSIGDRERNQLYADFAEVVAGFGQAHLIWEGNAAAREGEERARLSFAEAALGFGDVGLAEAQVSKAEGGAALSQRIAEAKAARARTENRARWLLRTIVGAVVLVLAVSLTGSYLVYVQKQEAVKQKLKAESAKEEALEQRARVAEKKGQAESQKDAIQNQLNEISRLSDIEVVGELLSQEPELWPANSTMVDAMRRWIGEVEELGGRREIHEETLSRCGARSQPYTEEDRKRDLEDHPKWREWQDLKALISDMKQIPPLTKDDPTGQHNRLLSFLRRFLGISDVEPRVDATALSKLSPEELRDRLVNQVLPMLKEVEAGLSKEVQRRRTWRFDDRRLAWQHKVLQGLLADLARLLDDRLPAVRERLERARSLRRRSIDQHRSEWQAASAAIRGLEVYKGLELRPQEGLVPLGRDKDSGLWEFADIQTGAVPERDAEGRLVVTEDTGLVLVLIPGGRATMGAAPPSPGRPPGSPHVDPRAEAHDQPIHTVDLAPFFLSKYEMTQAQWKRLMGESPSLYFPGWPEFGRVTLRNPVENVNWHQCVAALKRIGLVLPTEAQWDYAARAGTTSIWWTGGDKASLQGAENLADLSFARNGRRPRSEPWDDTYPVHAPVGQFRANPFGLHDVAGNVTEWCRDRFGYYTGQTAPESGERLVPVDKGTRSAKGGSFGSTADAARSAFRPQIRATTANNSLGLRPSRSILAD